MDFNLTEEQSLLRETLNAYLADNYSFETRQKRTSVEGAWQPDVWGAFASELGILGANFPESLGGLGGGAIETMIIMQALGEALVVEPYLATTVIAGGFLQHANHPAAGALIEKIIAGEAIFAFAFAEPRGRFNLSALQTHAKKTGSAWTINGHKAVVIGATAATHLIVTARNAGGERDTSGVSVFIVESDAPGVERRDFLTVDGFAASDITFEDVQVNDANLIGIAGEGLPLIERVVDEATVAVCAEACGVLRVLLAKTLEYVKQRKQFGASIGSFQAIQHRLADMFVQVELAVSMTYMATLKLTDDAERPRAVSAAKVQIGKACKFVGQNAIQLHGGMGMTDEMPVAHYFKRSTMIETAFGSTDHHLARYESLVDAVGA